MSKKNPVGRPRRSIPDSKRTTLEKGLPLGETRYMIVLKKDTIETGKNVAKATNKKIKEVYEEGIHLVAKKYKVDPVKSE